MTTVTFVTDDGVRIVGTVREAGDGKRWALLLHMMPATKESYAPLMEALAVRGVSSLAIDFRGHGKSTETTDGRTLDYTTFAHPEHQAKIKDVEAAVAFLEKTHGVRTVDLVLVGASIGANLALQYAAAHADVPGAVLLSPGLNYRDVATMPLIQSLTRDRHVFLASSADDEISGPSVEKLMERSLAKTDVKQFADAGHGTRMFETYPAFLEQVADWVTARLEG
ncbi:alpha/beta fold hydrolase [Patescibacteria group bacterium]|nr:MAG: alpha/beta fold hydrolase [Patescibacteria group bacterium]